MITVNVNNQNYSFEEPVSLGELLRKLEISASGIAVAVNNRVVARSNWQEFLLEEGCKVLVVQASQGG